LILTGMDCSGIERDNTIGPAILRAFVTEGRFLENGKSEALVK